MNIVSRIGIAGMLALAALGASAAPATGTAGKSKFDVTGTWTVTSVGPGPATNAVLVLKQEGDKLSGTYALNGAAPTEITEARVLRTTIYFEVASTMPSMGGGQRGPGGGPPGAGGPPGMPGMGMGRSLVMKYTGSLSGDELKLTTQMKQTAREGDGPSGVSPKANLVGKRQ